MELDEKERAFLQPYLRADTGENRRWLAGVVAGVALCVVSGVVFFFVPVGRQSVVFLAFVLGLALIHFFAEDRRKTMLARILQKYEKERSWSGAAEAAEGEGPQKG